MQKILFSPLVSAGINASLTSPPATSGKTASHQEPVPLLSRIFTEGAGMHPNKTTINNKLTISLGIILSLVCVNLQALQIVEQTEQFDHTKQRKQSQKSKLSKHFNQSKPPEQLNSQPDQIKQPDRINQSNQTNQPNQSEELETIQVEDGRAKNLIGLTGSASQGEVSQKQFEYRPLSRNGELMEVVPGAVATQHSGSGKANQYFLRGYNLDHGTDFTTIVDGIPMNMPTHAHGQGYMDTNSIIPELVKNIQYGKGPYYAEVGDFSAAGYAKMFSMDKLPAGIFKFTAGQFDYYRTLAANSSKLGSGDLLYAGEFNLYNGVWQVPEDSRKFNGLLRYTLSENNWGLAVNAKGYTNNWTATNQIPQSAIDSGLLSSYGSMDPTDGGNSNRYSFSTNLWNKGKDWKNDANIYAVYYDVDLWSNFTGYTGYPSLKSDQIHQFEHRVQTGGNIEHTRFNKLFGFEMDNSVGLNFRHDEIMGLGLDQTYNRQYVSTFSHNNVSESTAGLFFRNETHWLEKFRTIAGVRGDFINNDVTQIANGYTNTDPATAAGIIAANSGHSAKVMVSPKLGFVVGPWHDTEYFLNLGYGYHSNDARGTLLQINPSLNTAINPFGGTATAGDGTAISRVTPMAWARGGEVGARSNYVAGLNSTLAFWWLESSQELVFNGNDGTTTVNGLSHRYGVEFTNYYKPSDWLTLDADLALTTARFVQTPAGETNNYVPTSVGRVVSVGATAMAPYGIFGTVRLRHFGDVPLDSSGQYWAGDTSVVNLGTGYQQKNYKLELDIFNIFDSKNNDIAYAYQYAYPAGSSAQTGIMKHPVEPRSVRGTITINF